MEDHGCEPNAHASGASISPLKDPRSARWAQSNGAKVIVGTDVPPPVLEALAHLADVVAGQFAGWTRPADAARPLCRHHPGQFADSCSPCRAEAIGDRAEADRTVEPVSPPPAAGLAIPPERKAELDRLGDEARRAVAQARAEAASRDTAAIAGCDRCDDVGLLPTRVPCMHPRQPPPPGTGRAAFRAAREQLATRRCTGCQAAPARCLDAPIFCCPDCSHTAAQLEQVDPAGYRAKLARLASPDSDALGAVAVDPAVRQADGRSWTEPPVVGSPPSPSPCRSCDRSVGHQPGCPDDPAADPFIASLAEPQLLDVDPAWGDDAPPY